MSENVVVQMPERETETVFLVEAGSSFELNCIRKWIEEHPRHSESDAKLVVIGDARDGGHKELKTLMDGGDISGDPWLQPLRVIWKPQRRCASR